MIIDPGYWCGRARKPIKNAIKPFPWISLDDSPQYAILRLTTPHYKVWSGPIIKMGKIMELWNYRLWLVCL